MKLIKASYEILDNSNPLEIIERAGRVCYQSEPAGDPEIFVRMLMKRKHGSVLEHAWFAAQGTPSYNVPPFMVYREGLLLGNARAWRNNVVRGRISLPKGMKDLCPVLWEGVKQIEQPGSQVALIPEGWVVTVNLVTDRGVTHEWVRHRRNIAFSQESTRYCLYKDQVIFIIPPWSGWLAQEEMDSKELLKSTGDSVGVEVVEELAGTAFNKESEWLMAMARAEQSYLRLIKKWSPQQARSVLPNSLKTQIVTTTHADQWKWIFHMRCASDAHPQMRELTIPMRDEFESRWPNLYDGDYEPHDDCI